MNLINPNQQKSLSSIGTENSIPNGQVVIPI